jgi:hypothetical protein
MADDTILETRALTGRLDIVRSTSRLEPWRR